MIADGQYRSVYGYCIKENCSGTLSKKIISSASFIFPVRLLLGATNVILVTLIKVSVKSNERIS